MNLDNSIVAANNLEGNTMQKFPLKTLILCVTVLVAIGLVRDSLCQVEYQSGGNKFAAVLAYEVK